MFALDSALLRLSPVPFVRYVDAQNLVTSNIRRRFGLRISSSGRTDSQPVCGELLIPGRSVIRHTHDQKLDHRAFDYHSPTGPSPRIKFSVPTGLVTPWLQRIFNRHADQLAQVGEAFVRDQREALLLYLVRHEERTPPIMLDRSATVAGLLLCLTAPA